MKMKKSGRAIDALTFCCSVILCFKLGLAQSNTTVPVKVGIVLDLSGTSGKVELSCINMALSDFYLSHSHYSTRLLFNVRDSHRNVVNAASQAIDLINTEEVQAIIGPSTSVEANFVISLGDKAHVPIVTFSATSPSLATSSYFFRIAQVDSAQVNAIGAIVQAFGWKEVVPIYVDDDYGKGVIPFLTNALQQVHARIPHVSAISRSATNETIEGELYKLMTMQTRVFVVHMSTKPGARLFTIAKQIGMMNKGFVWIVTDGLGNLLDDLNSSVIESVQGVLALRTMVPRSRRLDNFRVRWKRKFVQDNPTLVDTNLNVFGTWAYDATTALAMVVEKVGTSNLGFDMSDASGNFTDLDRLGVSKNGKKLREALLNTRFRGLNGEFSVIDGQLQASTLEIINVNGNGGRRIGIWTPQAGLTRNLRFTNTSIYSTSRKNLGPIIWPGDTSSLPKGWVIPANEKKMRIGVPVKEGYTEFVKISYDSTDHTTDVTGFSIDVFKAVLEVLPYALPYEFIPFAKPNGEPAGTYDDLISQVYQGNFDAVVGDTTITANRSNYVDFTMPYTESGGTMIVRLIENKHQSPWAFLKPLTWDLWVTTAFSFVFVGFVVWVLEHRINEQFRGPPSHQIGTSLWFSFSIMVFAHREKVVSNWARFVVMMWVFVVLILVQSYTASLTSLLTVRQLRPSVTDVNYLIKNGLNVGYSDGSFLRGILKGMGFQDSQLIPFNSIEQNNELFTLGTANGGIDAAFYETPNVKLFLAAYCSKYTTAPYTFRTDGFGYVFPIGSPLVADISRAILNVTQGDQMKTIENKWFRRTNCPENDTSVSSDNLSVDSFWGLFLIAGVASVSALCIYAARFLYQNRHVLLHYNPSNASIWKRIGVLLKIFDDKDLSSHTFRKSESSSTHHRGFGATECSPGSPCPPSPSSQTESNFSFSAEYGNVNPYGHAPQDLETSMVQQDVPPSATTIAPHDVTSNH